MKLRGLPITVSALVILCTNPMAHADSADRQSPIVKPGYSPLPNAFDICTAGGGGGGGGGSSGGGSSGGSGGGGGGSGASSAGSSASGGAGAAGGGAGGGGAAVRRASPFAALPSELAAERHTFVVPISYSQKP